MDAMIPFISMIAESDHHGLNMITRPVVKMTMEKNDYSS